MRSGDDRGLTGANESASDVAPATPTRLGAGMVGPIRSTVRVLFLNFYPA